MELTPKGEIEKRVGRLQSYLKKDNLESCLILQNVDLFYFSGTIQHSYLFIPQEGDPLLMVQKDFDRARKESPLKHIVPIERPKAISPILKRAEGLKRIGLECDILPVNQFRQLEKMFPQSEFVDISKAIKQVRMIKSQYEIDQLRHSAVVLDEVFGYAQKVLERNGTGVRKDELGLKSKDHSGFQRLREAPCQEWKFIDF